MCIDAVKEKRKPLNQLKLGFPNILFKFEQFSIQLQFDHI
ncbi:hypothetical protein MY7_2046 [Bacillus sp. CN2]|jgi:hypothetical protein|nr:hypothetical protein U471_21910 [Bacillus amyloliquefaciens CC178]ANF37095.1 hypothetical protein BCBMB205_21990 [Bacillus velezensis]EIF13714.1 hypothetical protein MY7_2046 [Bacillus sp. 5B6]QEY91364.1 hypothetical protein BACIT_3552 [Bacillus amyloliquefaciens]GFR56621.1 hypothetical protein MY7_2046 [Bacillus sp. CN2]